MSWLFSQALVEDCSVHSILGGEQSVQWSLIGIADAYWLSDKITENLAPFSQYGMIFVHLTESRGATKLMLSLEDFLAKPTQRQQQGKTTQTIFGRKCSESWQMSLPGTFMPKTSVKEQLNMPHKIAENSITKQGLLKLVRQTWVLTTYGQDIGYLHTPTTQGNYCAASMQKHQCCRNWLEIFGEVTPRYQEWMMGWPIGWTELRPLETGKSLCHLYQQSFN
jgi:hypothetical protein